MDCDIFEMKNWKKGKLVRFYEDSDLKYLEEKATLFHNKIDSANKYLKTGCYVIATSILGSEKENSYSLRVCIKYNHDRTKSKKNSHRQKISV